MLALESPKPWAWQNLAKGNYMVGKFGILHFNGKIFVFGGWKGLSGEYTNKIMRYSINDDAWETLLVRLPIESDAHAVAIDEKFAWIALQQQVVVFDMDMEQLLNDPAIPSIPSSEYKTMWDAESISLHNCTELFTMGALVLD